MIKKHKTAEICDHCGTNTYEYCSVKNTIGRSIFICKKCAIKNGMIEQSNAEIIDELPLLTPKEILGKLNDKIIGQEDAKKALSVEIYSHVLRLKQKENLKSLGIKMKKNNILLTGLSGSGKTLLAEVISEVLNIPMVIVTATQFTEHGYSGSDVETMFSMLLEKCDNNIKLAEKGIVFLDEIDKLASKDLGNVTKDVNAVGVQKSLLKFLEKDIVRIPPNNAQRIHPDQKLLEMDTTDILFICGGAFSGVEQFVEQRLMKANKGSSGKTIGFATNSSKPHKYTLEELRSNITAQDLHEYGMLNEFLGRFTISNLMPLSVDDMIKIISLPGGILAEFECFFKLQGKNLIVEDSAIESIARMACTTGLGARSIRNILKTILQDIMFEAPSDPDTTEYYLTENKIEKYYKSANLDATA